MIYDNDEREDLTLRKEMGLLSLHLMKLNDEVKYDEGDLYESPRNNVYGLLEDVYDTEDELLEEFKEFRNDTYGMLARGNVDRPDIDTYDPILGFMQQYKIENDDREKQKRRSLEYHFDNVVGAISDEDGKREISLFEKFRRFQRDFLWTLGRTLGDVIKGSLKGVLNLTGRGLFGTEGIGNLIGFGRDNRSIQEKILEAIDRQTEFFLTGKIDQSKSLAQRLKQYGLLGTAVRGTRDAAMRIVGVDRNRAQTNIIDRASGVEKDYSRLGRSERILEKIKDSLSGKLYGSTSTLYGRMSPIEKSKEDILDEVKFSNIILKNISKQIDPINRTTAFLLKEAYGISENVIANTNNSLLEYNRSSLVEKARYEDSMEFWEETRGDLIEVADNTKRTAKEVEKHRKQAFFQRMMGMVGNILKGIGSLAGAIASALGLKRILGKGVPGVGGPVGGPKADPKSGGRLKYVMGTIAAVGAALAKGGIGKVISKGSDLAKSVGSNISKGIRDKGLRGYTEGVVSGGRRLVEDGAISTIMKKSPMTKKVVEDGLITSMKDKSFRDMAKATATTAALGGWGAILGAGRKAKDVIKDRRAARKSAMGNTTQDSGAKVEPKNTAKESGTKVEPKKTQMDLGDGRRLSKTKALLGVAGTVGVGTVANIALDSLIENTDENTRTGGLARAAGKGTESSITGGLLGAITGAIIGGVTGGGFGAIPGALAGWKAGSLGGAIGGTGLGLYEHRDAIFGNKTPTEEPKNVPENVSPIVSPHHTRNPTDIDGSGKIKEANNNGDIWASPFKKEEAPDERFSSLKAIQESIALPFDHIKDMYDKLTKTTDNTSETLKEGNDIAKEMAKTLREMAEKMDQAEGSPLFGMGDPSLGAFE